MQAPWTHPCFNRRGRCVSQCGVGEGLIDESPGSGILMKPVQTYRASTRDFNYYVTELRGGWGSGLINHVSFSFDENG